MYTCCWCFYLFIIISLNNYFMLCYFILYKILFYIIYYIILLTLLRALNMMHTVEQDFCQKLCSVFGQD